MILDLKEEDKIQVLSSGDIYPVLQRELQRKSDIDRNKEHFWVIGLNMANMVLYIDLVSVGGTSHVTVEPMQVFRVAVQQGASAILIAHNHPSGSLIPSEPDKEITERLLWTGKIIEINLVDHLIISEKKHFSFLNEDILKELDKSNRFRYIPDDELLKLAKRHFQDIAARRGRQETRREIARAMKSKGYAVNEIVEVTGLGELSVARLKVKNSEHAE